MGERDVIADEVVVVKSYGFSFSGVFGGLELLQELKVVEKLLDN